MGTDIPVAVLAGRFAVSWNPQKTVTQIVIVRGAAFSLIWRGEDDSLPKIVKE